MEPLTSIGPYTVGRVNGELCAHHPKLVGVVVLPERSLQGWIERQVRASLVIPDLSKPAADPAKAAEVA